MAKQAKQTKEPASEPARRPTRSRYRRSILPVIAGLLGLAGVSAAAVAALQHHSQEPGPVIATPVKSLPVAALRAEKVGHYAVRRAYTGQIVARRSSRLGFERSGLVTKVLVDDGARVKAGQVLARLDIQTLNTQRNEAAAQLSEIEERLKLAKLTEGRRNRLFKRGHSSAQLRDEAGTERRALEAQRTRLRASLNRIDVQLGKSVLRAPYDAIVVSRLIDEGTVVSPGQALIHVLEHGRSEARIGVPMHLTGKVIPGSRHDLIVQGRKLPARVRAVVPDVAETTRTVTVILTIDGPVAFPDGTVARLVIGERVGTPGFWLPTTALTKGLRGLWSVYVLKPATVGGKRHYSVARSAVEILHVETSRVFVRGALADGDLVIGAGIHRVVPNQIVHLDKPVQGASR